jgi:lysozyme family protein
MVENFENCLKFVLQWEGGYVDDPHDRGGATNYGVTQAVYNEYLTHRGELPRLVRHISRSEVKDIYKRKYWDVCRCGNLPLGMDLAVFDFAVNSGPARALSVLTRADDIETYCLYRLHFLERLPGWKFFGHGWERRVEACRALALKMANGDGNVTNA